MRRTVLSVTLVVTVAGAAAAARSLELREDDRRSQSQPEAIRSVTASDGVLTRQEVEDRWRASAGPDAELQSIDMCLAYWTGSDELREAWRVEYVSVHQVSLEGTHVPACVGTARFYDPESGEDITGLITQSFSMPR